MAHIPSGDTGLLEQHNSAGGDKKGEHKAEQPATQSGGQGKLPKDKAGDKGQHACNGCHIEAEQKAGNIAVLEAGEQQHISCKGEAGGKGQCAAGEIKGLARGVEQGYAHRTQGNAEQVAGQHLLFQEDNAADDHD